MRRVTSGVRSSYINTIAILDKTKRPLTGRSCFQVYHEDVLFMQDLALRSAHVRENNLLLVLEDDIFCPTLVFLCVDKNRERVAHAVQWLLPYAEEIAETIRINVLRLHVYGTRRVVRVQREVAHFRYADIRRYGFELAVHDYLERGVQVLHERHLGVEAGHGPHHSHLLFIYTVHIKAENHHGKH